MKHFDITVVNQHHGSDGEYIGRGSPLGNPYPIDKRRTRDQVCDMYEEVMSIWLKRNEQRVVDELNRLAEIAQQRPLKLRCFCAPKRCHGDTIKRILEAAIKEHNP